jgi:Tol biopolymer transport system component
LGDYEGGFHYTPIAVQVKDGSEKPVTSHRWHDAAGVDWFHDGSGLVVAGQEKGSTVTQLWSVQLKDGGVKRITNDLNNYSTVSLSQDSRTMCTILSEDRSNLWIVPRADASKAVQITSGKEEGLSRMTFTADGRIVYSNLSGGNGDIWICNADGSNQKQLTMESSGEFQPAVSPDGGTVFFVSDRSGIPNIWKIQIDGSKPQQLTFGGEDYFPEVSVDGKWLYFSSWDTGPFLVMKIPVEGGEPTTVFSKGASYYPKPSPDGKLLAFVFQDDQRLGKPQILIMPSAGGEVVKKFELPTAANSTFQWTTDSRMISYIYTREDVSNIWVQALNGGEPRKLTDFKSDYIFSHAWSPDGKQLAVARGQRTSDVVLISNFR